MIETINTLVLSNSIGKMFVNLFNDSIFIEQVRFWLLVGGGAFLIFLLLLFFDERRAAKGMALLKSLPHEDRTLSSGEVYSNVINHVGKSRLNEEVISKWINTQAQLTTIGRSDFTNHILRYVPGSYDTASGGARYFLLAGLFFTFLALSNTFMEYRGLNTNELTTFIQSSLIPSVGVALTSTLVAIFYSVATIFVGVTFEKKIDNYRLRLEEFIITQIAPHNPTANPVENTNHLLSIHKDLSNLAIKTIEELRNVSSITNIAYSDLSGATNKFVEAFDSTQKVIHQVESTQERIVEQNRSILTAAEALKDSVMAIQRVFELEDSALKLVKDSIVASNTGITENSKQLEKITVKFNSYNDQLATALGTSSTVLGKVNDSVKLLNGSHEANSIQVSKYVDLLTNNFSNIDKGVKGITLLIDDAKGIEGSIQQEVEKIKVASTEFSTIKSDAKAINRSSAQLQGISDTFETSSKRTTDAMKEFKSDVNNVNSMVKEIGSIKPEVDKISRISEKIENTASNANSTQQKISGSANKLDDVARRFHQTYGKYISRLQNIEHRPSLWSRTVNMFSRK
jgi:methyl-accepting chemotaxis protein